MDWCRVFSQKITLVLALVVLSITLQVWPVCGSFSIEYVDKPKRASERAAVILYECGSSSRPSTPVPSPLSSPNRGNPAKGGQTGSEPWPVACKRVDSRNEMQNIISTNNFFVVRNPTLAKGEQLYDEEAMAPLKLPSMVNVGVEFDTPTFPKLEQPTNLQEARRLLAKLKSLYVLPYSPCPERLVNFFSISDINYVTRDSPEVVQELTDFVAVLDKIVEIYYEDYYRTFWMWFDMEVDTSLSLKYRTESRLVGALIIVLPKMIDPCLIMSHQSTKDKNTRANKYCSSYCRALVVAADIFKQKDKTCSVRWGEGKCRNNKCICIKAIAGLRPFAWNAPMHRCNNEVVQSNIHSIFRSLERSWPWTEGLLKWIFLPNKYSCSKIPD